MTTSRLLGVCARMLFLSAAALVSTTGYANTCPTGPQYNGYCLDGLVPGSYPFFDTGVDVTWDKKNSSLTASFDNSGGESIFHVSSTESYEVTNTKFDFEAIMNLSDPSAGGGTYGDVEIYGHIPAFLPPIGDNPAPLLMRADLTGAWAQDGTMTLIGFNTTNIFCHAAIDAYVNCTTAEVIYFDLAEALDFNDLGKNSKGNVKSKPSGVALTSVPVPAAVWLFGSGLLGLVAIARRKKAA
jgi:hypothetical protein